jgi:hypothetical protein
MTLVGGGRHAAAAVGPLHVARMRAARAGRDVPAGEKDTKWAQKLGQLQPFIAVFPQECMGQLASSGQT